MCTTSHKINFHYNAAPCVEGHHRLRAMVSQGKVVFNSAHLPLTNLQLDFTKLVFCFYVPTAIISSHVLTIITNFFDCYNYSYSSHILAPWHFIPMSVAAKFTKDNISAKW